MMLEYPNLARSIRPRAGFHAVATESAAQILDLDQTEAVWSRIAERFEGEGFENPLVLRVGATRLWAVRDPPLVAGERDTVTLLLPSEY